MRLWRIASLGLIVLLIGMGWLFTGCSDPGPLYRGKNQADWGKELCDLDADVHREAFVALLHYGSSSIPYLIKGFDRLSASEFITALDSLSVKKDVHPQQADFAVMGLKFKNPGVANAVGAALRQIGPDARKYQGTLLDFVVADPAGEYAKPIAAALPGIKANADLAIPALVEVSLSSYVDSIWSYGCYYTDVVADFGEAGIGQLETMLSSTDEDRVSFALTAAEEMGPEAMGLYGSLLSIARKDTTFLDNPIDDRVVDVLASIGEPVVPRLVDLYDFGSRDEKLMALQAMSRIKICDDQVVRVFKDAFMSGDNDLEETAVAAFPEVAWADKGMLPELVASYQRNKCYSNLLPIAILDDDGVYDVDLIKDYLAEPRPSYEFDLLLHTGDRIREFLPEIERHLKTSHIGLWKYFGWCEILEALGDEAEQFTLLILENQGFPGPGDKCIDDLIRSFGDKKWPYLISALDNFEIRYRAMNFLDEALPNDRTLFNLLLDEVLKDRRAHDAYFVLEKLPQDHSFWVDFDLADRLCRSAVTSDNHSYYLRSLIVDKIPLAASVILEGYKLRYDLTAEQEIWIDLILQKIENAGEGG